MLNEKDLIIPSQDETDAAEWFDKAFKQILTIRDKVKLAKEEEIKEFEKKLEKAIKDNEHKAHLYHMSEFSGKDIIKMTMRLRAEAEQLGGLPANHSEVYSKRGWILPYLLAYESLFWGRWDYWTDLILKGTIEDAPPIPKIEWAESRYEEVQQVRKMLSSCMDFATHYGATISDFADWLLWGLGQGESIKHISPKMNEHWYKKFDLALVLRHPTDYLSQLLSEESSQSAKKGSGYFPTPFNVTIMMNKMVMNDRDDMKYEIVNDPCIGCGAMLLPASNYCFFGFGQDISHTAIKLCQVQMYWYAPWFAMNPFDRDTKKLKEGSGYANLNNSNQKNHFEVQR